MSHMDYYRDQREQNRLRQMSISDEELSKVLDTNLFKPIYSSPNSESEKIIEDNTDVEVVE